MAEDYRLPFAPVFVINLRSVFGGNRRHEIFLLVANVEVSRVKVASVEVARVEAAKVQCSRRSLSCNGNGVLAGIAGTCFPHRGAKQM
jgi:hypothetical protein